MLKDFQPDDYSWESYIMDKATGNTTTPHPTGDNEDTYILREDQREDVNTIVEAFHSGAPEFLVANGTGTGKTVTTLAAVKEINPKSVLIICPAPVIPVWRKHIADMGDGGRTYVVINYESLKKIIKPPTQAVDAKKTSTQNKHIALHGTPYEVFDMVIADEAHKTKNPTSQQSRIVGMMSMKAPYTLKLTATPGKDPAQLHHLWRLLSWNTGDPIKVSDEKDFGKFVSWCGKHNVSGIEPAPFGNGIVFKGDDTSVRTFEELLYGSTIHPRTAIKRVPDDWSATVRQTLPVKLTQEDKKAYEKVVSAAKNYIIDGKTTGSMDMTKGLAALISLRQKAGILKAPHAVDYAKYCIDDLGEQVVITAVFHNTVEVLSQLLDDQNIDHVIITGETEKKDKENLRIQFQKGEVPVVITTITTGISLHEGEDSTNATDNTRRMIVVDTHWSPIEHTQLEGRINRNGKSGVITIPFLHDTVDEKVISILLKGLKTQGILQSSGDEQDIVMLAEALGITL